MIVFVDEIEKAFAGSGTDMSGVKTEMTGRFSDDAPWTPPELAPRLVRELASGRFDALSGRYIHAEHDPPDELERRIPRILEEDLNAIRLRRES